jgi:hypothetical protein
VSIVLKSGSLNLLEPSGPVKGCNGIALPLPLPRVHISEIIDNTDFGEMVRDKEKLSLVLDSASQKIYQCS